MKAGWLLIWPLSISFVLVLAFSQEFFPEVSKIYCQANFSIVFGPDFRGAKVSEAGQTASRGQPPTVEERQTAYVQFENLACLVGLECLYGNSSPIKRGPCFT